MFADNTMTLRSKRQPNHGMLITGYYIPQDSDNRNNFNYDTNSRLTENNCRNCEYSLPLAENPQVPRKEQKPEAEVVSKQELTVTEKVVESPSIKVEEKPQIEIQKPK